MGEMEAGEGKGEGMFETLLYLTKEKHFVSWVGCILRCMVVAGSLCSVHWAL